MKTLFSLVLCLLIPLCLSAQQEDDFALTVRYGRGTADSGLSRFDLDADLGEQGGHSLSDQAINLMKGDAFGLDLRSNVNGRVLVSASADFFRAADRNFIYGTIPGESLRLPLNFRANNDFQSLTGSLGLHYRITPDKDKLDIQFGLNYHYTFYWHNYASYLRFGEEGGQAIILDRESERISSSRQGLSASARIAYPIIGPVHLTANARYGIEVEMGEFDRTVLRQVGIMVTFNN